MIPELEKDKGIIRETDEIGSVRQKTVHFRISRKDTLVNDLKNSTAEGIVSSALSVVGLILLVIAVIVSFYEQGSSGVFIGLLPVLSLLLSVASLIFATAGLKRKDKIRHYMEKRGLAISLVTIAILIALYIRGLVIFLQGNGL